MTCHCAPAICHRADGLRGLRNLTSAARSYDNVGAKVHAVPHYHQTPLSHISPSAVDQKTGTASPWFFVNLHEKLEPVWISVATSSKAGHCCHNTLEKQNFCVLTRTFHTEEVSQVQSKVALCLLKDPAAFGHPCPLLPTVTVVEEHPVSAFAQPSAVWMAHLCVSFFVKVSVGDG